MKKLTLLNLAFVALFMLACNTSSTKEDEKTSTESAETTSPGLAKNGITDLSESSGMKDVLCQNWENRQDLSDNHGITESANIQLVSRGFSFAKDNTVIKDIRGDINTGTWSLDENKKPYTINIKYADGSSESYQIAVLKPFELTLNSATGGEKKLVEYAGAALGYKDNNSDPFYIANNKWRIKPSKAETDDQIKARMKNFLHFYVLFYEYNINSKSSTVNFNGLPSCFRWYAGGVFIYKVNEVPEKWINCFYNKDQAMKGYKIAEDLVSKKYKFPKGQTNWLKANLTILKMMEGSM